MDARHKKPGMTPAIAGITFLGSGLNPYCCHGEKLEAARPGKAFKKRPGQADPCKASRPDVPTLDPSLADILNPAIGKGRAGLGAQTGAQARKDNVREPSPHVGEGWEGGGAENYSTSTRHLSTPTPNPSPQGGRELEPP